MLDQKQTLPFQRLEVKKGGGVSIYNIGQHVLLRFPF